MTDFLASGPAPALLVLLFVSVIVVWVGLFRSACKRSTWPEPKPANPITPLGLSLLDKRDAEIEELAERIRKVMDERNTARALVRGWQREEQKRIGVMISRAVFRDRAHEAKCYGGALADQRTLIRALKTALHEVTTPAEGDYPSARQRGLDLLKRAGRW